MGILAVRRGPTSSPPSRPASAHARPRPSSSRACSARSRRSSRRPGRGDAAVIEATERFDGVRFAVQDLRVRPDELAAAHEACDPPLLAGIREAIRNSRLFNEAQVRATASGWREEVRPGFVLGEQVAPIPSVGLYVPAGKGSFPSVLVQVGVPALVAGVPAIAVLVPPMPGTGAVDGATLATARELGLANVFRANGPAGIAALTFGTATLPRVRKIVGPGSPAVTAAQVLAQRFGTATNMLCGPSESLLLADATADPWRLALDLVNEAEHGQDSAALVVTDAPGLVAPLEAAVAEQVAALPELRRAYAGAVLGDLGGVLLFDTDRTAPSPSPSTTRPSTSVATATGGDPARLRYAGDPARPGHPIGAAATSNGIPATLDRRLRPLNGVVTALTFQTTSSLARQRRRPGRLAGRRPRSPTRGLPGPRQRLRGRGLGTDGGDGDPGRRSRASRQGGRRGHRGQKRTAQGGALAPGLATHVLGRLPELAAAR